MDKTYIRIIYQNQPSTATALGATNLNKMDYAINEIDNRVVAHETSKAELSIVNNLVQSILYNDATGVMTITKQNGTSTQIDTKLEKLAVNFSYDPDTQQLVITLDDGTKQYVDLSSLITQYEFSNTDTISFTLESGVIKASIINGSITDEKMQPNYLADIVVQAQIAVTQANLSKRYAVGGVEEGDATDNAKYYKERAEVAASQALEISGFDPTTKLDKYNLSTSTQGQALISKGDGTAEFKDAIDANVIVKKDGSVPMDDLTIGTRKTGSVVGLHSFTQGADVEGSGDDSHAEGRNTVAIGIDAHAEGNSTAAVTNHAHGEGLYNLASNGAAYIITQFNNAAKTITLNYIGSLAVGDKLDIYKNNAAPVLDTPITNINGLVVTLNTVEVIDATWLTVVERDIVQYPVHVEGRGCLASGPYSHTEGSANQSIGSCAHSEGANNDAIGYICHAEGQCNTAYGAVSHSEGYITLSCSGILYNITAFNNTTKTITLDKVTGLTVGATLVIKRTTSVPALIVTISAINALVVTVTTKEIISSEWTHAILPDSGYAAHAEGYGTIACAPRTHAEGGYTIAMNNDDHAEGYRTIASGGESHAGGYESKATANQSFAHGLGVLANGAQQTVFGRYNAADTTSLLIVGIGTSDTDRRNALKIDAYSQQLILTNYEIITQAQLDAALNDLSRYANNTLYNFGIHIGVAGLTIGAGNWSVEGCKMDASYGWQEMKQYAATGRTLWVRSMWIGVWNAWVAKS